MSRAQGTSDGNHFVAANPGIQFSQVPALAYHQSITYLNLQGLLMRLRGAKSFEEV